MQQTSFDEADLISVILKPQQFQWRHIVANRPMYVLLTPTNWDEAGVVAHTTPFFSVDHVSTIQGYDQHDMIGATPRIHINGNIVPV